MNFNFKGYSIDLLLKINEKCKYQIDDLTFLDFDFKSNTWFKSTISEKNKLVKTRNFKRSLTKELRNRSDLQNDLNWVKEFFNVHSPINQNCDFKNSVCIICNRLKGVYEN